MVHRLAYAVFYDYYTFEIPSLDAFGNRLDVSHICHHDFYYHNLYIISSRLCIIVTRICKLNCSIVFQLEDKGPGPIAWSSHRKNMSSVEKIVIFTYLVSLDAEIF